MKKCSKCGETKELEEFHKDKSRKDGRTSKCKVCVSAYYQANKEKRLAYLKANKEKITRDKRAYMARRMAENPSARIANILRTRIGIALSGRCKSASTLNLLGCDLEHFRFHLESQFTEGMTWENHGEWHIDHIQPCASFNLEDEDEQRKCFHYTNMQPLWASDNLRKSDRIVPEHQVNLI